MVQHQSRDTLDTNLIVHYIMGDIPKQRKAVARLLDRAKTTHLVPISAINEAVYVFEAHYEQDRVVIATNLQKFLETFDEVLEYDRELIEVTLMFYAELPALSFHDCCLASYAELEGAEPLFTFDKKLAKQHPSAKLLQ